MKIAIKMHLQRTELDEKKTEACIEIIFAVQVSLFNTNKYPISNIP